MIITEETVTQIARAIAPEAWFIPTYPSASSDPRHPWLKEFDRNPIEAFGELIAGHASVHPYDRGDAPDVLRILFYRLDHDDPARLKIGPAVVAWLEERCLEEPPTDPFHLQRYIREVCEAFEIIWTLRLTDAAIELRRNLAGWTAWTSKLTLCPTRDAFTTFLHMLDLTQNHVDDAEHSILAARRVVDLLHKRRPPYQCGGVKESVF